MPSLIQFGARTSKNATRATNLADGRFLHRNSSPRDAGKYIRIYYGEMRHSQKRCRKLAPRHQSRVRGKGRSTGQGIGSREEGAERREERLGRREGRGGQAVGGRRENRGGRRERREEGGRRSRQENGEGKEERERME